MVKRLRLKRRKQRHMTTAQRKRLRPSQFALPGRRYPIHDSAHGKNALARVAQYGSPSEKAAVRRKVHARYPNIGE